MTSSARIVNVCLQVPLRVLTLAAPQRQLFGPYSPVQSLPGMYMYRYTCTVCTESTLSIQSTSRLRFVTDSGFRCSDTLPTFIFYSSCPQPIDRSTSTVSTACACLRIPRPSYTHLHLRVAAIAIVTATVDVTVPGGLISSTARTCAPQAHGQVPTVMPHSFSQPSLIKIWPPLEAPHSQRPPFH